MRKDVKNAMQGGFAFQFKHKSDLNYLSRQLPTDETVLFVSDCIIPEISGRTLLVVTSTNLIFYKNRERVETFPLIYLKHVDLTYENRLDMTAVIRSVVSSITVYKIQSKVARQLPTLLLPPQQEEDSLPESSQFSYPDHKDRSHRFPVPQVGGADGTRRPSPIFPATPGSKVTPPTVPNPVVSPQPHANTSVSTNTLKEEEEVDDFLPPIHDVMPVAEKLRNVMPSQASMSFVQELENLEDRHVKGKLSDDEYQLAKAKLLGF